MGRARAVPLIFKRKPGADLSGLSASEVRQVKQFRTLLERSQDPAIDIQMVLRKTSGRYALRRAIFLSDGYLYAETPLVALRLSQVLRLDHLFEEPTVMIKRGSQEFPVTLEAGRYFLPEEQVVGIETERLQHGPPASLLLFDRVRTPDQTFQAAAAFSLERLSQELAFDMARPLVKTADHWVFELKTRGVLSTAVLDVTADEASLICESSEAGPHEDVVVARNQALHYRRLMDPILGAAREIIARGLPFDEPRTEEGQQDGLLRIAFRKAHRERRETYEFNGDSYYTYDGFGRPRLPEVCIDFITDAFDWGTGASWSGRGKPAVYRRGALNFASFGVKNERSVESLLEYAAALPEWFDVHFTDKAEQVKFIYREKFFQWLALSHETYRVGDVVFILGLRDDEKYHYHSFFIDQKDPVTGMPMLVLANAGPPQARTIEGEMQNAPLRTIIARIRLRTEVLEMAQKQAIEQPGVPLTPPKPPVVAVP